MNKILIALDYGPSAEKVAETGYRLARKMASQVILLHVLNEPAYYTSEAYSPIMGFTGDFLYANAGTISARQQDIRDSIETYLNSTRLHLGDATIETMISEGNAADVIVETALTQGVDIIVLGSHSRTGFEKLLMGSVAEKVLHHSTVPLFIVPGKHA